VRRYKAGTLKVEQDRRKCDGKHDLVGSGRTGERLEVNSMAEIFSIAPSPKIAQAERRDTSIAKFSSAGDRAETDMD
jgi:hypothetical protein